MTYGNVRAARNGRCFRNLKHSYSNAENKKLVQEVIIQHRMMSWKTLRKSKKEY